MAKRLNRIKDISGKRFGRWTAISRFEKSDLKNNKVFYKCRCDCGNEREVSRTNLVGGISKSCGCLKLEIQHKRKQKDDIIRLHQIVRYYKRNAKTRNYEWKLTQSEAEAFIVKSCHYCGYNKTFVGIDRLDKNIGYVLSNCVPRCKWCNFAKHDRTLEEFKKWINDLYRYLNV